MAYKFLSTISGISTTFTGNSVYSNSTPNRTVKLDAIGLYLSRTSDGAYPSSITADGSMYYDTRNSHIFRNDATTSMTIVDNTRNVLIGTSTDAGYKLDVNGTARINSTLSLTNSSFAGTFSFYLSAANIMQASSSNIGTWLQVGGGNRVYIIGQEFNSTARGNVFGNTVGGEAISATTIIAQSSGTTATTGLSLRYTINNTGTYVGTTRGIYYNPTVTSLTGTTHYAIETVVGDVILGSTSGNVGIGTTTLGTATKLTLSGSQTASSAIARGGLVNTTLVAAANNDVLVGLDIAPTFTNGAFTGVQNQAVRIQGNTVIGATSITNMQYGVVPKLFVNGDAYLNGVLQLGSSWIKINGNNISWENTGITNNLPEWRADATGIKFGNYNTLPLRISIGGTENVRFFSTGNSTFGGTTDAGYKLDVVGTARIQGQLEVLSTSSSQGILLKHTALSTTATQIYYNSANAVTYLDTLYSYTASQPFGSVDIRTKDSSNTLTSRLYVEGNSGNIGIGTTTFLGKFQVGSGSATQFQVASSGASIYVGPSSGNYNMNITTNTIQSSNSGTTNTFLHLQPNGTGNITMCSTGTNKVLIGTTTDAGYKLDVNGTARVATSGSGYKLTVATTGGSNGSTLLVSQLGYTMLDVNASDVIFKPYPSPAGQITTNNWNSAGGSHTTFIAKNSEFTPTGIAYAIPIAKFPDANIPVVMGNTATANLRSYLTVSGNFTSISNLAAGQRIISTLTAAANNDVLVGLDINPTFTNGAYTGVKNFAFRATVADAKEAARFTGTSGTLRITPYLSSTYGVYVSTLNAAESAQIPLSLSSNKFIFENGNVLIGATTDNGNKLQVTGSATVSGNVSTSTLGVQNSAEINVNESGNNLLVYADITSGPDNLYSGGQVKANIYTSSVTTPTTINTGTTVSLMNWYPATTQGVMIDYVFYIDGGTYMRSGTFTAVNDTSGNAQYVDNATPDLNGSTSTVTFAAVNNGGTMEFQVTNTSGNPVYMNILTRYIPTLF